jgi:hypothetical protein
VSELCLRFDFSPKLAFHGIGLELGFIQHLDAHNKLGVDLAGQIYVTESTLPERASDLKVIDRPTLRTTNNGDGFSSLTIGPDLLRGDILAKPRHAE